MNAKSKTRPAVADILAQANLDGGGNTDAPRRARTPLPVLPKASATADIAVAAQRLDVLEQEARELMTRINSAPAAPAVPKPVEAPESVGLLLGGRERIDAAHAGGDAARSAGHEGHRGLPATAEAPFRRRAGRGIRLARYVEDWRAKIERIGNLNYPEAARSLRLYGSLLLTVSIRSDGSVENVEINRSSGDRVLDAAAVRIVEMSAPFAAFPPDIKRDTDVLHITRTWMFTKGDELRSE